MIAISQVRAGLVYYPVSNMVAGAVSIESKAMMYSSNKGL